MLVCLACTFIAFTMSMYVNETGTPAGCSMQEALCSQQHPALVRCQAAHDSHPAVQRVLTWGVLPCSSEGGCST
jgi:hypothetical protein